MNLLVKYCFHTPMIRFVGKRDGLQHKPATNQSTSNQFSFDQQARLLSTVQPIPEKIRNLINLGGVTVKTAQKAKSK